MPFHFFLAIHLNRIILLTNKLKLFHILFLDERLCEVKYIIPKDSYFNSWVIF